MVRPRITAVATAVPPISHSQVEVLEAFNIQDRKLRSVFLNGGIERRNLCLPRMDDEGRLENESQKTLLTKHLNVGLDIGKSCILECLIRAGVELLEVEYLCCVSSTGFIIPGFSAQLIKQLGLSENCARLDVVGMGCNAGLNGLAAVTNWSTTHPDKVAILVCIEVCSALYCLDGSMETAVVNSLFGDGASAIIVKTGLQPASRGPEILDFSSCLMPERMESMSIDWSEESSRFRFSLGSNVPYDVGANVAGAVTRLLGKYQLSVGDITHWLIHSGGKKVIDAVRINLGLTRFDLRHTLNILRKYGNLSSGAFLFSYEMLMNEARAQPGDFGVMMTMGPGLTIETALLQW